MIAQPMNEEHVYWGGGGIKHEYLTDLVRSSLISHHELIKNLL